MQQPNAPGSPGTAGRGTRRGLFSGKGTAPARIESPGDTRLEAMLAAYQKAVAEQLEEGLRAIQQSGVLLMQEIAGEVWRTAGGDKGQVQAQIVESLSRDQAIRGLIAHSDERFQALTLRTARLEDALTTMAETTRALKGVVAEGVQALRDTVNSPALQNAEEVRGRLAQIEQHLAATFERLDERDRLLVASLEGQIREHGTLVRNETGRIVEALEGYVKDGVSAMGNLAQRVEQQAEMMYERVGMDTRNLTDAFSSHESWILRTLEASSARVDESLEAQVGKVRDAAKDVHQDLARVLEQRVQEFAELVRSDSDSLRHDLREANGTQSREIAQALDERLEQLASAFRGRTDEVVNVLDRNMVRVTDTLESELERLGQRTSQAVDGAVQNRFDATIEQLNATIDAMNGLATRVETATQDAVRRNVDERVSALARMIRSDNRILLERLQTVAEQDQAKQALRAVKELQASLPNEMTEVMERRLATLADSVSKSDDALAQRIERIASRISGYDNDMQSVIERMGDAMHAIASLGRRPSRIELD